MHPITNKLIKEAVDYLLGGRYEKPKEEQTTPVSPMGIHHTTKSERTVSAVSPIIQTS